MSLPRKNRPDQKEKKNEPKDLRKERDEEVSVTNEFENPGDQAEATKKILEDRRKRDKASGER